MLTLLDSYSCTNELNSTGSSDVVDLVREFEKAETVVMYLATQVDLLIIRLSLTYNLQRPPLIDLGQGVHCSRSSEDWEEGRGATNGEELSDGG